MYFDSRFDLSKMVGEPAEPACPTSHHLLDVRPLELVSSMAWLAVMLGIGESDGIYPVHQVLSGLPPATGDTILPALEGVESELGPVCSAGRFFFDLCPTLPPDVLLFSVPEYGRNRSLVNSKISDPMPSMAPEYLSRLILDSDTINSAKRRTRSSSVVTVTSLSIKF